MKRLYVFSALCCSIAACGKPANIDPKAPAEQPAVINMPSAAQVQPLPFDSAKAAKRKSAFIPDDPLQRTFIVGQGYGVATATMVNQDGRQLAYIYGPDAVLVTPDSTVRSAPAIAQYLLMLSRTKSLFDFQRTSRKISLLDDSTLTDSGTYVMTSKRLPKNSVVERGRYASRWRAHADPNKWVILEDYLVPDGVQSKRAR